MDVVSVMAHQDDELVCLGTMLKMQAQGDRLHFICLTDGSCGMLQSPEMSRTEAAAVRDAEMRDLAGRVGATYSCLGEPDEYLYDTPDVRDSLIEALRATSADLVFTHFSPDYNADHMAVNLLVRHCAMQAAFPVIRTESRPLDQPPAVFLVEPSGGFEFEPTHYVDISDHIPRKMELCRCHKSQDDAFRAGLGRGLDDWVVESSRRWGEQSGCAHAEAFRPMLARGLVRPRQLLP
jgi:LmbE family N-acetylglucosaminyl deacetylase